MGMCSVWVCGVCWCVVGVLLVRLCVWCALLCVVVVGNQIFLLFLRRRRKAGRKEGRKEKRKEGRKEGTKEGTKEGRKECLCVLCVVVPQVC